MENRNGLAARVCLMHATAERDTARTMAGTPSRRRRNSLSEPPRATARQRAGPGGPDTPTAMSPAPHAIFP